MATTSPLSQPCRQHGSDVCPVFTRVVFKHPPPPPLCHLSVCTSVSLCTVPVRVTKTPTSAVESRHEHIRGAVMLNTAVALFSG